MGIRLSDLAAVKVSARTSGGDLTVRALTAIDLADILAEAPQIMDYASGGEVTLGAIIRQTPEVVAIAIARAAGTGSAEDIKAAKAISPPDQLAILEAIMQATFPSGLADFFSRLAAMAQAAGLTGGAEITPTAPTQELTVEEINRLGLPPEATED